MQIVFEYLESIYFVYNTVWSYILHVIEFKKLYFGHNIGTYIFQKIKFFTSLLKKVVS